MEIIHPQFHGFEEKFLKYFENNTKDDICIP